MRASIQSSRVCQKKAKAVFQEEISMDEKKLHKHSEANNTEEIRKLLSIGLLDVDCEDLFLGMV